MQVEIWSVPRLSEADCQAMEELVGLLHIEEVEDVESKAGILPREPRKGFYKLYTDHALSAMKGAGLE